jgi:signal transduction histidine kinase
MGVAMIVAACCMGLASFALSLPSLGLQLAPAQAADQPPEILQASDPRLLSGERRLSAIGNTSGERIELRSDDLAPEPDTTFPLYPDFNAFLARQTAIDELLRHGPVTLYGPQGVLGEIHLESRELGDLPWQFWLQMFVAAAGLIVGTGVWAFRRKEAVTRYFALTGLGLFLSAGTAAIYSTRELAIDGSMFRLLHNLNSTGSLLFCGAFVSVLWHHPVRLARFNPGPWLVAGFLGIAALNQRQWLFPGFDEALRLPVLAGFVATLLLGVRQWQLTRGNPVLRASLKWFLFAWLVGSGLFLLLVFVPALAGTDTGSAQAPSFALFLLIYLGIALGIARYRLFDLGRWWFGIWTTLVAAFMLVCVDLALISALQMEHTLALMLSLLLVGTLYLPLRGWLWKRLVGPNPVDDLPTLVQNIALANGRDPLQVWVETLQRMFNPLQVERLEPAPAAVELAQDGLKMRLPPLGVLPAMRLCYAGRGSRLFSPQDLRTVQMLQLLCSRLFAYGDATRHGMEQERQRIARDMHDSLGGRLLTLLHQAPEPLQPQIRELLDDMRLTVHCLNSGGALLEEALGQWRAEVAERCDSQNVQLRWQQPTVSRCVQLDAEQMLHLVRLLRELVSNALKHAQPTQLCVQFDLEGEQLLLSVENDRCTTPPAQWKSRVGLNSIRYRVQALGGTLDCSQPADDRVRQSCRLPLAAITDLRDSAGARL